VQQDHLVRLDRWARREPLVRTDLRVLQAILETQDLSDLQVVPVPQAELEPQVPLEVPDPLDLLDPTECLVQKDVLEQQEVLDL